LSGRGGNKRREKGEKEKAKIFFFPPLSVSLLVFSSTRSAYVLFAIVLHRVLVDY
jgi:hypothetical protein